MAEAAPLTVLVVDDEPLAVERMQLLLARCPNVTLAGTGSDGEAAIRLVVALSPDVVLLDISMPGMDGIDVARALAALPNSPVVVFVTAFDSFAVAAFEVEAVDYLMKPADPERLARALDRARAHLEARRGEAAPVPEAAPQYLEEFWASDQTGLVRISVQDIDKVTAERDYMRLHVGKRSWLVHHSMAKLEEGLDPDRFVRLHRSAIVRRDFITGLRRDESGSWYARLADQGEQKIGRLYLQNARSLAGR
ncbi:MAG TPA: LytTR family DNA-binding domain-containing protein [Allosphingosinicella sp.]|nr:LytTR family DNA-binding domain-containing protein [Allosphingosinicella sp.]